MNAPVSFDFNSKAHRTAATNDAVNGLLVAGMRRKRALQPRREYVGASGIGGHCERAIQFEFAGAPREREPTPEGLRKMELGHMAEEWARYLFLDAGFDLRDSDPHTGKKALFTQLDGRFKGHPDGVFHGGPPVPGLKYPFLWEHKGVGRDTYKGIERDGLQKFSPTYYAQVAIYQTYLHLSNPALFTVSNLDSGEQMHIAIPLDLEEAQLRSDRAVRIIKATDAGELLPRPFKDPTHFVCKGFCDFPERCWKLDR
jgi:hypothetical protein